ncbi:MAG TPA: DUF4845 domain-containing protein [Methylothermaceae bacterium]|nr:DUF4845 domain-containing protein [Methylothermaceae bacterium]
MNRHPGRQSGMTLIGMVLVAFLIGFFTLLILKIGPIYLEHYKVITSLKSLEQMPELARKSRREVRSLLEKRLDINMVENVTRDDIQVLKEDGVVTVAVTYEVEKPLFGNLSVVAYFDDQIEVARP